MKTSQSWYVVSGSFRLYCTSKESVQEWVSYILARGGAPVVEANDDEEGADKSTIDLMAAVA